MNIKEIAEFVAIIVAIMALIVSFFGYLDIRRYFYYTEQINKLIIRRHKFAERLYYIDKIIIEFPEIQTFIYKETSRTEPYFVTQTPHNEFYFRAKTFIYMNLNIFNEVFSVIEDSKIFEKNKKNTIISRFFEKNKKNTIISRFFEDSETNASIDNQWKKYCEIKLQHPLFREVFDNELKPYCNKAFREFVSNIKGNTLVDPEHY